MDAQSILSLLYFTVFSIIITFIGFPLVYITFKNAGDRGFAFSKLFTILLFSYFSWILGFLVRTYSFTTIFSFFILVLIASCFIFSRNGKEILKFITEQKKLLLFEEMIFWIFFFGFIGIRAVNPDLWHPIMGGEKPMDFAFLNGLTRAKSLPPFDPWFAGGTINYYYFGQFIGATIIKLLGIKSSIFYNLFLCYLFAQSASGIISIVFTFTKSRVFSFLGAVFLLLSGNLAQIPVIISSLKSGIPINGWY